MKDSATASGELPLMPVLVRNSPMQEWWASSAGRVWDVASVAELAETTDAGDYNVTMLSQDTPPLDIHDRFTFLNHNADRYANYGFRDDGEGSRPHHARKTVPLRHAVRAMWTQSPDAAAMRTTVHYSTAPADDFVPALARTLMEWLPEGCLRDDRFEVARSWDPSVDDYSQLADCRDLNSIVWLGESGVGATTHYDISHNVFFQLSGSKQFTLLHPQAHSALRLFPFWHGSNRQAQAALPADETRWVTVLKPGDALVLPSRWFHRVKSLSATVGVNWWSGGLDRDVWMYVLGAQRNETGWSGGSRFTDDACAELLHPGHGSGLPLLGCVRDALAALLSSVEDDQQHHQRAHGLEILKRRATTLVQSRYAPLRSHLKMTPFATAVGQHCEQHPPMTGRQVFAESTLAAVEGPSAALRLLSHANRDLALNDLLDHIAAWTVGQAGRLRHFATSESDHPDGAAVEVFLRQCCVGERRFT